MDLVYIAIGFAFFLVTWGLVLLCEVLENPGPGGRS
jgi:hypothetical protein